MLLQVFKKFPLFLCAGMMLVFISCKGDKTEKNAESAIETETVKDASENTTSANTSGNEAMSTTDNSPKLNPAHGQPGHRCDIQVGQPLPTGSSPVNNTSKSSPVINSSGNNSSNSGNVNPAHGQPGHRCDIPVGAPLN